MPTNINNAKETRAFGQTSQAASRMRPNGTAALSSGAILDQQDFVEACLELNLVQDCQITGAYRVPEEVLWDSYRKSWNIWESIKVGVCRVCWSIFILCFQNGVSQKLRRIILLHLELVSLTKSSTCFHVYDFRTYWECPRPPKPIMVDYGSTELLKMLQ